MFRKCVYSVFFFVSSTQLYKIIYKHIDVLFESGRFFRADDITVCDVTVSGRVSVRPHEFGTCCLRGVPIG